MRSKRLTSQIKKKKKKKKKKLSYLKIRRVRINRTKITHLKNIKDENKTKRINVKKKKKGRYSSNRFH